MDKFEIQVGAATLSRLINGELSIEQILDDYFKAKDGNNTSNYSIMAGSLRWNHIDDAGSPDVYDFEVEDVIPNDENSGSFTIRYTVFYYFGCDDMNTDSEAEVDYHYEIDIKNECVKCEMIMSPWVNSNNME